MPEQKTKKSHLNMNAGLWSSKMDGRIDLEKYNSAARRADNFLIRPSGMLERRPGTKFISRVKDNGEAKLWSFQFDSDTGYIIEVGVGYMRFYNNGALITESGIACGGAARLGSGPTWDLEFQTTGPDHNFAVGDRVTTTGFTPAAFNVTNALVTSVPSSTVFRVTVDSDPGIPTVVGTWTQPFEVDTSYIAADLDLLQTRQLNDVVILTHPTKTPARLKRLTTTTFELEDINFALPPFRDENVSEIELTISATSGTSRTLTATAPAWVTATFYRAGRHRSNGGSIYVATQDHTSGVFATDLANGLWELVEVFTTGNENGYFRLGHRREATDVKKILWGPPGAPVSTNGSSGWITILGPWTFTTSGVWWADVEVERRDAITGNIETIYKGSSQDGARNISVSGDENDTTELRITVSNYQAPTVVGAENAYAYLEASDAFIYGYCKVQDGGYTSATQVTVDIIQDFEQITATDVWAEGSWSDRRGFPVSADLYEQRLCFAGNTAQPLTIWGSVIGDLYNHDYGDAEDDRAFQYSIPSTEQNQIEWIIGGKAILIGNGKEHGILSSGSDDLPITPSNVSYRVQEAVGFNNLKPEIIGPIYAGVERNGRRLREVAYKFDEGVSGGYVAADLNRLNDEITESGIVDIAYAQLREPYIYCVNGIGDMGVLAYNRNDGIIGWTNFTVQGNYESVAVIRGTDHDEVWVIRENSSDRFVERFHPTTWSDISESWYVDSGVYYQGAPATTFTGLEHLEGEEVQIMGDGSPRSVDTSVSSVVTNGSITITEAVSVAVIGKQFISTWSPMRLDIDSVRGSSQGMRKNISHLNVRLYKSATFKVSGNHKSDTYPLNETDDLMDVAIPAFTGEVRVNYPSTYGSTSYQARATDNDPQLFISQELPVPLSLVAVIINYHVSS